MSIELATGNYLTIYFSYAITQKRPTIPKPTANILLTTCLLSTFTTLETKSKHRISTVKQTKLHVQGYYAGFNGCH